MYAWVYYAVAALVSAAALLAPCTLSGQTRETKLSFRVRWLPVDGVARYRVEVRGPGGQQVVSQTVEGSSLDVGLEPGLYEVRIASLNKFGREVPGAVWHSFRVEPPRESLPREARLPPAGSSAADRLRRPPPREPREDPQSLSELRAVQREERKRAGFDWTGLVPGMVQWRRGDTIRGSLFPGVLFASFAYGAYGYRGAEAARQRTRTDPLFAVYNNPLPYLALRQVLLADSLNTVAFAVGYRDFLAGRSEYVGYRREQRVAGGLFAVVYLLHLADVYLLGRAPADPPALEAFFRHGHDPALHRFWEAGMTVAF